MAHGPRHGAPPAIAAVLVLIAAMFGPALPSPAVAQVVPLGGSTTVSPVVIAQGVVTLPDDDIAWRVVRAEGESRDDQQPTAGAIGFVLAGADPILLSDLDSAQQNLLAPGEAAWVAGGSEQQRASLDSDRVTYTELSVVAEDDASAAGDGDGDGDLIFAGDGFGAPNDARKISLAQVTLGSSQSVDVPVANGQSLVFVSAGMVAVSTGGDLASGDAQSYERDVTLTNESDDDARLVIASIGDVVPPLPTFTGSATLQVRACPDGSTASSFDPGTCTPVDASDGFGISLLDEAFTPIASDDDFTGGEQTWDDLEFGTYPWGAPALPLPYIGTLWTDTDSVPLDVAQATVSAQTPNVTTILYVFPVTTGSISVTIANCPTGVTPDTLADATCDEPASNSTSLTLTTPDGETLDAGDASSGSGSYVFSALPVANGSGDLYVVDQPRLPNGYDSYLVVSGGSGDVDAPAGIALTSANPVVDVTIFNFRPASASPSPSVAPSAASGQGSITLQVFGCPAGVARGDSASYGLCTTLVDGASAVVVTPGGQSFSDGGSGGVFTFGDLAYGTYSLGLTGLPAGFSGAVAPGYNTSDASASRVNVTVSADNPAPVVTVFVFQ